MLKKIHPLINLLCIEFTNYQTLFSGKVNSNHFQIMKYFSQQKKMNKIITWIIVHLALNLVNNLPILIEFNKCFFCIFNLA